MMLEAKTLIDVFALCKNRTLGEGCHHHHWQQNLPYFILKNGFMFGAPIAIVSTIFLQQIDTKFIRIIWKIVLLSVSRQKE